MSPINSTLQIKELLNYQTWRIFFHKAKHALHISYTRMLMLLKLGIRNT